MAQVSALSPLVSLPTEVMGMVVENVSRRYNPWSTRPLLTYPYELLND